jgi:hypothetical protein
MYRHYKDLLLLSPMNIKEGKWHAIMFLPRKLSGKIVLSHLIFGQKGSNFGFRYL